MVWSGLFEDACLPFFSFWFGLHWICCLFLIMLLYIVFSLCMFVYVLIVPYLCFCITVLWYVCLYGVSLYVCLYAWMPVSLYVWHTLPGLSGLVWSGLVLTLVVWPGLVWSGVDWSGLAWSGLALLGPVWSGLVYGVRFCGILYLVSGVCLFWSGLVESAVVCTVLI